MLDESQVDKIVAERKTVDELKLLYLNEVQTYFSKYFEETYPHVELKVLGQKTTSKVIIKISPPLKTHVPPFEERNCVLSAVNGVGEEMELCTIEEICNAIFTITKRISKCSKHYHTKKIPNQVWPYSREFYGLIQVFLLPFDLFNLSIN